MARWTRKELLLALNLYHQTPFGKQHSRHPPIIDLAKKIGRTPGAVNMKLDNFTFFDPAEGGKGLKGGSELDREIWDEFRDRFEALADESEPLLEPAPPSGPTTRTATVIQRRHQNFSEKPSSAPTETAAAFRETRFPNFSAPATSSRGVRTKTAGSIPATAFASPEPTTSPSTVF